MPPFKSLGSEDALYKFGKCICDNTDSERQCCSDIFYLMTQVIAGCDKCHF